MSFNTQTVRGSNTRRGGATNKNASGRRVKVVKRRGFTPQKRRNTGNKVVQTSRRQQSQKRFQAPAKRAAKPVGLKNVGVRAKVQKQPAKRNKATTKRPATAQRQQVKRTQSRAQTPRFSSSAKSINPKTRIADSTNKLNLGLKNPLAGSKTQKTRTPTAKGRGGKSPATTARSTRNQNQRAG